MHLLKAKQSCNPNSKAKMTGPLIVRGRRKVTLRVDTGERRHFRSTLTSDEVLRKFCQLEYKQTVILNGKRVAKNNNMKIAHSTLHLVHMRFHKRKTRNTLNLPSHTRSCTNARKLFSWLIFLSTISIPRHHFQFFLS